MNSKDRSALRSIVKDRFKRINQGMGNRFYQGQQEIRNAIDTAALEQGKEHTKKLAAIAKSAAKLDARITEVAEEAKAHGLTLNPPARSSMAESVKAMQFKSSDTQKIYQKENRKFEAQYAEATENLAIQEQNIIESLILGDVGEDAKAWLDENVPTLETLVPLPKAEEIKALVSGD